MGKYSFEAAIFDMDGVITKTALVHAQAWKQTFDEYMRLREERDSEPFREFTHEGDYLPYVDGKPRYKGVKSFLESRGINIPFGETTDTPDKETACGIGNRKNVVFNQILDKEGVQCYDAMVGFIKKLKENGVRVGVASSSKNCRRILSAGGIEELFETRVDGEVSEEMGLEGKPEGDIFVVAAENLGAVPARSIVLEDATSGVQAGRNGGFGLVIGVSRTDNEEDLLANGADIVLNDISGMTLEWIDNWFTKKPVSLFGNWDKRADEATDASAVGARLNSVYSRVGREVFCGKRKPVFFLDYDGTLTPIVDRPELAVVSKEMQDVVKALAAKYTVAIVSGRMREDVESLLGIEGLFYAGSHGFDITGPGFSMVHDKAKEAIPVVAEITKVLKNKLGDIDGALVEEKKFSVAAHYRLVDEAQYLPRIKALVEELVEAHPSVRLMSGKKVFEILPNIDWNKGMAIRWIMKALEIPWEGSSVVYIGDDVTDEYAFRAVRTRGTGILVSTEAEASAADFSLKIPGEVKELFEKVIA